MTDQETDYVLPLSDNHPTLCDDMALFFEDGKATNFAEIDHDHYETVDGDHGRIEARRFGLPLRSSGWEQRQRKLKQHEHAE